MTKNELHEVKCDHCGNMIRTHKSYPTCPKCHSKITALDKVGVPDRTKIAYA